MCEWNIRYSRRMTYVIICIALAVATALLFAVVAILKRRFIVFFKRVHKRHTWKAESNGGMYLNFVVYLSQN